VTKHLTTMAAALSLLVACLVACSHDSGGLGDHGSGWILVRRSDCVSSSADHCWFDRSSCVASAITLEPNWIDPASTKAFALGANADWVAETLARP